MMLSDDFCCEKHYVQLHTSGYNMFLYNVVTSTYCYVHDKMTLQPDRYLLSLHSKFAAVQPWDLSP